MDDLQLDGNGRVLAAGMRSTPDQSTGFRVRRLKASGAWDETFEDISHTYSMLPNYILGLQALPNGRWLLQNPPMVLGPDGAVERALQAGDGFWGSPRLVPQPRASARVGPDGMIYAFYERLRYDRVLRWFPTGEFDFDYYATT